MRAGIARGWEKRRYQIATSTRWSWPLMVGSGSTAKARIINHRPTRQVPT